MITNRQSWCQIAGWTVREFDKRVAEGFPIRRRPASRGEDWEIDTVAGIAWISARDGGGERGVAAGSRLDLNAERARLAKEQANQTAMRNATARGELVPASSVDRTMISVFSRIRSKLLALPNKAAPRLVGIRNPAQVQALLTDYVYEVLTELANTKFVTKDDGTGGYVDA